MVAFTITSCVSQMDDGICTLVGGGVHEPMCRGTLAQVRPFLEFLSFTNAVAQYSVS